MSTPNDTLDCGHTLAELSTYLDTGDFADPGHLNQCPECQAGLAALGSISALGTDLRDADIEAAGSGTDDWMQSILDNLRLELRPGRSIPVRGGHADDILSETEGAISAVIRSVADALPGTAAGKCRLHGDVGTPGAPVTVSVDLAVVYGHPLEQRAAELRSQLADTLSQHTELNITSIDVTITDILAPPRPADRTQTTPEEKP